MSLAKGLAIQFQVVHAVVLRETRTRFGKTHLGYLWALFEPLMFIGMFWGLFFIVGRVAPGQMEVVPFLATGIIPFILFRQTANRCAGGISSNRGLLFYPQVYPLDLIIARAALEIATLFMVFIVIMGGYGLWEQHLVVDNALGVVLGLSLAGALGASMGLVFCGLEVFLPVAERLRSPLLRPLFWISGLFFTANELPTTARNLLLYNPLLHAVEMTRDGWFISYSSSYVSAGYVGGWILALTFLGLLLERSARARLEAV